MKKSVRYRKMYSREGRLYVASRECRKKAVRPVTKQSSEILQQFLICNISRRMRRRDQVSGGLVSPPATPRKKTVATGADAVQAR